MREIINDQNFVNEDVKTKKQQKVHNDRLKRFNSRSATTDKNDLRTQRLSREHHQNYFTEDKDFVEIEVATQKSNNRERREVNFEGKNRQINPSAETHNETVKEELFETPMGGSR